MMMSIAKLYTIAIALAAAWITSASLAQTVAPTPQEMDNSRQWAAKFDAAAQTKNSEPLFSFTYDGRASTELLAKWDRKDATRRLDDQRTERTTTWTDPKTDLEVTCVSVAYSDFPVVEWTVYFRNTGKAATPILADIQGMDVRVRRDGDGGYTLHNMRGDDCSPASYQPIVIPIGKETTHRFAPAGGRPTQGTTTPYFNVEWPGEGVIAVLGWPAQWAAQFACDKSGLLTVRGGQELTHLKLLPGEQIRTPLSVLMFWKGDIVRSQNLWRRWMFAHNVPRPGGKLPPPFTSICMGLQQSEAGEIKAMHSYLDNGVKQDYWWMDAGWYPCRGEWWNTGTWEPDPKRFPHGLKAVSDYAHSKGMKMVLWNEPERVAGGTWLTTQHPDWVFGGAGGGLLKFGNPKVQKWATEHFDKLIREQGVDLYREDFNIDPLGYWRNNDPPDRQGITENFHVQGHLAYWDELRRRHPDMLLDTCASGGRRNDLESLRRAVPLLRSDFQGAAAPGDVTRYAGNQAHTYGLSFWVPYFGTGEYFNNAYSVRSHFCQGMGIGYNPGIMPVDWPRLKKTLADWRAVVDEFYGDYYPLTPYSLSEDVWIAWQFNRPENGTGVIQAFRRINSVYESARVRLPGLEKGAVYTLTNLDSPGTTEMTGRELSEKGLIIVIKDRPGWALIAYKKKT
jgi:alpha-galactosidase